MHNKLKRFVIFDHVLDKTYDYSCQLNTSYVCLLIDAVTLTLVVERWVLLNDFCAKGRVSLYRTPVHLAKLLFFLQPSSFQHVHAHRDPHFVFFSEGLNKDKDGPPPSPEHRTRRQHNSSAYLVRVHCKTYHVLTQIDFVQEINASEIKQSNCTCRRGIRSKLSWISSQRRCNGFPRCIVNTGKLS